MTASAIEEAHRAVRELIEVSLSTKPNRD